MSPFRVLLVVGVLSAALAGAEAAPVVLVNQGQPAASIVLAKAPTRAASFAAAELQWHIQKITGATVPLVADDQPVTGTRILVGESAATLALGLHNADFQPQEYLVRVRPGLVILMGRDTDDRRAFDYADTSTWPALGTGTLWNVPDVFDEQATAYAVYDFLEKFCSVRWYLPTELGLCCPQTPTLAVSGRDLRRSPAMKTRYQTIDFTFPADLCGDTVTPTGATPVLDHRETMLWWHRLRLGGEAYAANHSLYGYYDRFLTSHPEYFAQGYAGRPPQMCYTNPGFIHQVIQDASDYFDGKGLQPAAHAGGDYFAVVPMDDSSWCKCPTCEPILPKAATRGQGQFSNDLASNYLFGFVNQVAQGIEATYPGKFIASLAYSSYAYPPTTVKLEPNVSIQMCLTARMVYNPAVQANDREILKAWVQESPSRRKLLWLYYCFPALSATGGNWRCFPGFFAHSVVKEMAAYHQAGIRGLYYEPSYLPNSQRSALLDQVESLVTWKLADDPTVDGNAYIDEFFTRYYGHAAAPMRQMYDEMEAIYSTPANYPPGTGHQAEEIAWKYLGTAQHMAELGALMAQAKAAAQTDLERRRVALFEKGIWNYMQAGRAAYLLHAAAAATTMQSATAARVPDAGGDSGKVDWASAGVLGNWRTLMGDSTPRVVEGRLAHDSRYLYLQLQEKLDPKTLVLTDDDVWMEDEWEIFVAKQRSQPYRQMGVNAKGTHLDLAYGENTDKWDSGAVVVSDRSAPDRWTMRIAFPLAQLLPGGVQPGDTLYLNVVRSTRADNALSWIPTFAGYHAPNRFGEVVLEK